MEEMKEMWVQSLGQEDPLEKEMATHSSILAWKIHGQGNLLTFVINTPSHPILVGISRQCRPTTMGGIPHSLLQCDFVWKALAMLSALKLLQNSGWGISAGPHSSTSMLLTSLCAWVLSHFSSIQLSGAPWTIAWQAPLSMRFSRQEYWSGLPFPSPRDLPHSGIKPVSLMSPALAGGFFTTEPPGKPLHHFTVPEIIC